WFLEPVNVQLKNSGSTGLMQSYFQWKWRLGANFDLNLGLHYLYFLLNGRSSIEPRFGAIWKLAPEQSINIGLGLHSKVEAISIYMAENTESGMTTMPNKNLNLMKSAQAVMGYSRSISKNLFLKLETYYQYLYDVPIYQGNSYISALNFGSGYTDELLNNKGTGTNYGIELTLEKYFSKNYFFMITGSLFDSKYIAGDNIERNTIFNSNFVTNLLAGKEFKIGKSKQNVLGINSRIIWKGGNRKIAIDLEKSILYGTQVDDKNHLYETSLSNYFRTDLGVSYRINRASSAWVVSLDIQNITNRANVYYEFYNRSTESIDFEYQLGTIPVIKVKIVF
ncbi:TonB-dependent receptor, partial [Flavobacteriales bacterium AH-315-E23]|nr:TonB-dependent receptor [Flavobacteriales bacterium AH-315-E23]